VGFGTYQPMGQIILHPVLYSSACVSARPLRQRVSSSCWAVSAAGKTIAGRLSRPIPNPTHSSQNHLFSYAFRGGPQVAHPTVQWGAQLRTSQKHRSGRPTKRNKTRGMCTLMLRQCRRRAASVQTHGYTVTVRPHLANTSWSC